MCQFQHRAGEGVWSLLGQVVTRVGHLVVHAGPAEVTGRRAAVRCREVAICQAVQGDSRDRDGRLRSKLLLDLIIRRVAGCVSEAMTVGVKHDLDIVGIVEGHRGAVQGGVIEVPVSKPCRVRMSSSFSQPTCRASNPQREEPTKPRTNAAISSAAVSKAK